jgi:hypothetical protein
MVEFAAMNHLDGYLGPEPPKIVSDTLRRRSLDAPGGYPVFRVVHSEFVYEQIGGIWNDWDDNVAVEDRGRISSIVGVDGLPMQMDRPIRTVAEIRTVPTYCGMDTQGWILERWFPAHNFGSPEWHYEQVVPGTSIPSLGPYPERGKYVMLTGPFPEPPSIDFLQDFISFHQQKAEAIMDQDVTAYVRQRIYDREQAEEKKKAAAIQDTFLRLVDSSKSILEGSSLAAGRIRSRAAEAVGLRSHVGN